MGMVDSGTSCLVMNTDDFNKFASLFQNPQNPCGDPAAPVIYIKIGDYVYSFTKEDYCLANGQLC